MPKVLVVATGRKTKGGITSVIKAYETSHLWKKYHCHWIQTHRDGAVLQKILYIIIACLEYLVCLPFYDIVHVHFSLRTSAMRKRPFVWLAKLFRKKVIVHLHCGTQIDEIWNENYLYLFDASDVSLFLSNCLKEKVMTHFTGQKDFRVCYNPCPKIKECISANKQNIILFSGTICSTKGYADLIKAFSRIAPKYPSWKVIFLGNGEVEQGKELAKSLQVESQVEFLGWVSGERKDEIFRKTTVFCLPSYAEGFPMAVLDAWAYGLPVITTPVGGIPDVAVDGENMLLFNPGDVDTLARQLERMITDENLRNHISEASHHFATHEFNIDTINKQLDALYSELLNKETSF